MPTSFAEMAHENRNSAIKAVQDLYALAADESRDLTPEETEQAERIEADIQNWSEKRDAALRAEDLAKSAAAFRGENEERIAPAIAQMTISEKDNLRRLFAGEIKNFESQPSQAFLRALQTQGGSAVPTTFSEDVMVFLRYETPMLNPDVVTVLETSTGEPITLPRLTADPNHAGTLTAEAAGINQLDPTLSAITLNTYKYAIITLWSSELHVDNVINLREIVAESVARELAIDIGTELTTADGSDKPNGIINAAGNGGTAAGTSSSGGATNTFFGPVDLIDLKFSLAQGYRKRGSFLVSSTALAKMRKFRDANGAFLFQAGNLGAGAPDTFDASPVYENPSMAAVASASKSVAFGDLKRYWVRRMPQRVDLSTEFKYGNDQVALRVIERVDGDLRDAASVNYLVSANT